MRVKKYIGLAIRILIGVAVSFPVFMTFLLSLQDNATLEDVKVHLFTANPTLVNYVNVFKTYPFLTYLKNSLIHVAIVVPVNVLLSTVSAFVFSFYKFKGRDFLFTLYLTTMMVPGEVIIVSNFMIIQEMGLINTYLGMTITSLASAGNIFMLRQSMKSLPRELWEASVMDGCGKMRYLFRIVVPLCKSIIAALAITSFIGIFNSYLWPMLVTTDPKMFTLQTGMAALWGDENGHRGEMLAAAMLISVAPMLFFIFGEDYIVEGLTNGAVKS